jgi:hypothetical protein
MPIGKAAVVRQTDDVPKKFAEVEKKHIKQCDWESYLDISQRDAVELSTVMRHLIEKFRPPGVAAYGDQALDKLPPVLDHKSPHLWGLVGILSALRADYDADRLESFRELVHRDVFTDFLEMAAHLLEQGYKGAAAVTAGSVLEEHVRQLCDKNSVPTTFTDASCDVRPKKLDTMNADLARPTPGPAVYDKIEQKAVTAWAAIRNAAAHGEYAKYTVDEVKLMIQGIRGFITRHPA